MKKWDLIRITESQIMIPYTTPKQTTTDSLLRETLVSRQENIVRQLKSDEITKKQPKVLLCWSSLCWSSFSHLYCYLFDAPWKFRF